MRTFKYIIMSAICSMGFWACSDDWDSHFSKQEEVIDNAEILSVDKSATEFLKSEPEYQAMYKLFEETGVLSKWENKDLLYTIMVVNNDKVTRSEASSSEEEINPEDLFLAQSHITDALLSPSNLKDGQRLLMWNSKYVNVAKITDDSGGVELGIYFNGSKVKNIIKTKNAYIYELEEYIYTPKSLMEYLEELPDGEYSIFKKMVFDRIEKSFNKAASTPIGIDKSGNTVYDSVFVMKSPYFLKANNKYDLFSENLSATLLVPNNDQITNALAEAKAKLKDWDVERPDSTLNNWIFQVAFFNKRYTKEDFTYNETDPNSKQDFQSIFDQQWRTTVNKVDLDNPIELSNAVAYKVTSLKIPANKILIWRFKERFGTFTSLTEEEIKYLYYEGYNADDKTKFLGPNYFHSDVREFTEPYTPNSAWPKVDYKCLYGWLSDSSQPGTFSFKLYKLVTDKSSSTGFRPVLYKIPAGEYNFRLGTYVRGTTVEAQVYINDKLIPLSLQYANKDYFIPKATIASWDYDRGGGGFHEYYNHSKYDRDGQSDLGNVVFEEDTEDVTIKFVMRKSSGGGFTPSSWCLRPTANFY